MEEVDITGAWVVDVGQAQTADELRDGDSAKTIHRSSKVRVVNVESRGACRTDSVSSIHQSNQTSSLKLHPWLSETFTNNRTEYSLGNATAALQRQRLLFAFTNS